MIFFITTIVPSSNFSVELRNVQKILFQTNCAIPSPIPLLITYMSEKCPQRPTRKDIFNSYPPKISIDQYRMFNNELVLLINEAIPLIVDESPSITKQRIQTGIVMSYIKKSEKLDLKKLPIPATPSFNNYSLICYEINTTDTESYWLNMSWNKIWEVKKGKKKI